MTTRLLSTESFIDAPTVESAPRRSWVAVGTLALAVCFLACAPLALDDSYSVLRHTTSESAGQGVHGAWVARTGFVLFGLAVVIVARARRAQWRASGVAPHLLFAACMVAVATYSSRPWDDVPFDRTEDLLHSAGASIMGFAFATGVLIAWFRRRRHIPGQWTLDAVALAASVVLPLAMLTFGSVEGALQRAMFAIAALWYGREALA